MASLIVNELSRAQFLYVYFTHTHTYFRLGEVVVTLEVCDVRSYDDRRPHSPGLVRDNM